MEKKMEKKEKKKTRAKSVQQSASLRRATGRDKFSSFFLTDAEDVDEVLDTVFVYLISIADFLCSFWAAGDGLTSCRKPLSSSPSKTPSGKSPMSRHGLSAIWS
jgi:hypothetical protein